MATYSSNQGSTWILSAKIALISTGVLSMAMALKLSVPVVADFVSSEVPSLWSFALSWLKPPYLYVVINGIIISIVASSKLHHRSSGEDPAAAPSEPKVSGGAYGVVLGGYGYGAGEVAAKAEEAAATVSDVVYGQARAVKVSVSEMAEIAKEEKWSGRAMEMEMDGGDEAVGESKAWNGLQRKDSLEFSGFLNESGEKPPVSARFGHRKAVKSSPEGGKSLRVTKPRKQDTLEATWKTITEGRPMPLTRHLKKSDTWESHVRRQNDQSTPPSPAARMKKSETFPDRSSDPISASPSPGSGKIRKEPSLSQDELNRRVEAFIKKFNEEMRLQRQESLNQYQEMVRRGAQ